MTQQVIDRLSLRLNNCMTVYLLVCMSVCLFCLNVHNKLSVCRPTWLKECLYVSLTYGLSLSIYFLVTISLFVTLSICHSNRTFVILSLVRVLFCWPAILNTRLSVFLKSFRFILRTMIIEDHLCLVSTYTFVVSQWSRYHRNM